VQFLPYPYKYRQPFGLEGEAGDRAVIKYIETILNDVESGVPKPACVVLECIQGEGGCGEFPDEALRELRRITQEHGIYMIVDEVQTGFCRSGNFFSFQRSGIVPDVLCMSKALGGGMPMAVMAFKEELNAWSPGAHTGTFRGNQMAFATGKASIRYMMESKLWEQVAEKGVHFKGLLDQIKADFPVIGDIRGRGLMVGIEFVDAQKRDHTGVPKPDGDIAKKVQRECFKRKLILERGGRCGAVIRFLPPLIITNEELTSVAGIFREAIECAVREFNPPSRKEG
jgi:diaminobutyrate-2-oxoglutarate transaminase